MAYRSQPFGKATRHLLGPRLYYQSFLSEPLSVSFRLSMIVSQQGGLLLTPHDGRTALKAPKKPERLVFEILFIDGVNHLLPPALGDY